MTVAGTWRVVHAPHLYFLANFALAKFRPIEYRLTGNQEMAASVQYRSLLGNFRGWLSTSGTYDMESTTTGNGKPGVLVRIVWDKCWWNIGEKSRPTSPQDGDFANIIQFLGMIGFIELLSFFPIRYVDDELAIFTFFGLRITAAKCEAECS